MAASVCAGVLTTVVGIRDGIRRLGLGPEPSGSERLGTTAHARAGRSRVASRYGRQIPVRRSPESAPSARLRRSRHLHQRRPGRTVGSGITLTDKSRTAVSVVTLAEFVQGGIATVERHGYESVLDTGYHPPADEGWKAVARAEFGR
jgi:hypothetical protein